MKKKVTIVIPCKDDELLPRCISSIDYDCKVLVVFNGSPRSFVKKIKNHYKDNPDVLFLDIKEPGIGWALEMGTRAVKTDLIFYMDSDCTFERGAIEAFIKKSMSGDPDNEVYKGEVVFAKGSGIIETLTGKSRTHHTAETLSAYVPPVMIAKTIIKKIGGYAFDKRLTWREDSDFDNRIKEAGLKLVYVPEGIVYHKSLSLRADLKSTFNYGVGFAIATVLHIKLTEVPKSVISTFKSQGLLPALYMIFRNRIYDIGYLYGRYRIARGEIKLESKPSIER